MVVMKVDVVGEELVEVGPDPVLLRVVAAHRQGLIACGLGRPDVCDEFVFSESYSGGSKRSSQMN